MLHPFIALPLAVVVTALATYLVINFISWFAKSLAAVVDD